MYCHACGKQIPDGIKFCLYCGAAQNVSADADPAEAQQPAEEQYYYQPEPAAASYAAPAQDPTQQPPEERFLAGVFGALLCSLAGVAVQVILIQLGYVAALSGVVLSVCTLMGYAHFARRMSVKGIIVSVVIIIVMVLVGMAVSNGVTVMRFMDAPGLDRFRMGLRAMAAAIPNIFRALSDPQGELFGSVLERLLQHYGFAALGAVPTIVAAIRSRKK